MSEITQATDSNDFLTSREAALQLGVSLRTVQLWVESGILRAWKTVGGHRRIARRSVDAILRQQQDAVTTADRKLCVVVVEDEPMQRELYRLKFEEWNLPVDLILAEDAFEGLLEIGRNKPDVILSDLSMPGMDGFNMIRAVNDNEDLRHAKIIAISGFSEADIEAKGGLPSNVLVLHKTESFGLLEKLIHDIFVLKNGRSAQTINKQEEAVC